jgi:type IV secretion system protein TrbB
MNALNEMHERLEEQLCFELGRPILRALEQPDTTDVQLQDDGTLWVREHGTWKLVPNAEYPAEQREIIIGLVAHSLHQEATFDHPSIEGELIIDRRRFRFTGLIPLIVPSPIVAIRKPAEIIYSLDDYEREGIITTRQRSILHAAVIERENILIVGGMGSGKTTLANTLIDLIPHEHHVGTIEDRYELQIRLPKRTQLHTSSTVDLRTLVRLALSLQFDRIIIGEVRGREALDLLTAWNLDARGGIATIHANSATAALIRLDTLMQQAGIPPQPQLIAETLDLIVFIELQKGEHGAAQRRVTEILQMEGLNVDGNFELRPIA